MADGERQTGSSEDPDTDQIRKALLCKRIISEVQMQEAAPVKQEPKSTDWSLCVSKTTVVTTITIRT